VVAEAPPPAPKAAPVAPASAATATTAEATPAAPAAIPTLVAEPVGGTDSGRFASGKAIIRHGDNLWTIAQRVYGNGVHYTMIWQANDNQIRDPHWIYPGQVFDLPKAKP